MAFWSRLVAGLFGTAKHDEVSRRPPPPPFEDRYGYLAIVGESQYQPQLRAVLRSGRVCWATVEPEPDNPFDGNAVVVKIEGYTVGYFPRGEARRYQKRLLHFARSLELPAKLIGGELGKPSIGVLLDHRELEKLPAAPRKRASKADPNEQPF
jgi:hypothetical protein